MPPSGDGGGGSWSSRFVEVCLVVLVVYLSSRRFDNNFFRRGVPEVAVNNGRNHHLGAGLFHLNQRQRPRLGHTSSLFEIFFSVFFSSPGFALLTAILLGYLLQTYLLEIIALAFAVFVYNSRSAENSGHHRMDRDLEQLRERRARERSASVERADVEDNAIDEDEGRRSDGGDQNPDSVGRPPPQPPPGFPHPLDSPQNENSILTNGIHSSPSNVNENGQSQGHPPNSTTETPEIQRRRLFEGLSRRQKKNRKKDQEHKENSASNNNNNDNSSSSTTSASRSPRSGSSQQQQSQNKSSPIWSCHSTPSKKSRNSNKSSPASSAAASNRDHHSSRKSSARNSPAASNNSGGAASGVGGKMGMISPYFEALKLNEDQVFGLALNYKLEKEFVTKLGFPGESMHGVGKAIIYRDPEMSSSRFMDREDGGEDPNHNNYANNNRSVAGSPPPPPLASTVSPPSSPSPLFLTTSASNASLLTTNQNQVSPQISHLASSSSLSINAKEFVPSPRPARKITHTLSTPAMLQQPQNNSSAGQFLDRKCVRCKKTFYVTENGQYITTEICLYHWGKLVKPKKNPKGLIYKCCSQPAGITGCTVGDLHVWSGTGGNDTGFIGPLDGYIQFAEPELNFEGQTVYALDCEMGFTIFGLELIRVTVVGPTGEIVYDYLVRPDNAIIDYNTRFSGISAEDIEYGPTKTLAEVQNDLSSFVRSNTLLVGHNLDNDLRMLKVIHESIIDTSVLFPHFNGLPYRRSLKSLAKAYLKRTIQSSDYGHNSYEDALACMDLLLLRINNDIDKLVPLVATISSVIVNPAANGVHSPQRYVNGNHNFNGHGGGVVLEEPMSSSPPHEAGSSSPPPPLGMQQPSMNQMLPEIRHQVFPAGSF